MTAPFTIGQTVVTDPGEGRSSGYVLVAASKNVEVVDREYLAAYPEVSNELHREGRQGLPFFSFFHLPSGAGGFSEWFTHGHRRGGFHRVVAHTLVFSEESLETLAGEPWLLVTRCRFRNLEAGEELTFHQLRAAVQAPNLNTLDVLQCTPPPDPPQAHFKWLSPRRATLLKAWGEERLRSALHLIYGGLASHGSILLPQSEENEMLLTLAWASLPKADRPQVPWTTHYAPGGSRFRLAVAPDPEAVRSEQANVEDWLVLGQAKPRFGPVSEALARVLAGDPGRSPVFFQDLNRADNGFGLLAEGAASLKLSNFLDHSLAVAEREGRGFDSVEGWENYVRRVGMDQGQAALEAWRRAADELAVAARTLQRLWLNPLATDAAAALVRPTVAVGEWLYSPQAVADVAGLGAEEDAELLLAAAALSAAWLASRELPPASWERLLDAIAPAFEEDRWMSSPRGADVLGSLALSLARAGSSRARDLFGALARQPGALQGTAGKLGRDRKDHLPLLEVMLVAEQLDRGDYAAELAATKQVPLLTAHPELLTEIPLDVLFGRLKRWPNGLVAALRGWKEKSYDSALGTLQRWLEENPNAGWQVVEEITREPCDEAIQARLSMVGMTELLIGKERPATEWLPFALAEAEWLDGTGDGDGLRQFLAAIKRGSIDGGDVERTHAPLLRQLHRAAEGLPCRQAHIGLFEKLQTGLVRVLPEETVAALGAITNLHVRDRQLWASTALHVGQALGSANGKQRDRLFQSFVFSFSTTEPRQDLPRAVVRMKDALPEDQRQMIERMWAPKEPPPKPPVPGPILSPPPVVSPLPVVAPSLAPTDSITELARAAFEARRTASPRDTFLREVERFLPRLAKDQMDLVAEALFSDRLQPSTKNWLEEGCLGRLLDKCVGYVPELLLSPVRWPERGTVVQVVARSLGRSWRPETSSTIRFLELAVAERRLDLIALFLAATRNNRAAFFKHLAGPGRSQPVVLALQAGIARGPYCLDLLPYVPDIKALARS